MTSLLLFVLIGRTADVNVDVECFMTVHTVIILEDILRQRNMSDPEDRARIGAENRLLAKLKIKCKECNRRMRTGYQEGKRYYYCNSNDHIDAMPRMVWVDTPPNWLDWQADTELASEKETNKDPKD
jgi:hypothetical protein